MPSVTETIQVLLVFIQVHYAKSEIRVQPRDTEAVVGQLTYLNCSTSIPSERMIWYHYPVVASESKYIYLLGQLQPPNTERYRVETQSKAEFNLVIQSVETGDAGKYVCQEEGEHGQYGIAELIVLDANPVCGSNMKEDGVIGTNSCYVKPEEIQLSCTVSFHGYIPPIVEWIEVGKDDVIEEGIQQEISARHVTSFLTISGHHSRHGSSFACQTRRSTTKQNRCISDGVKVIYAFDTLTSKLTEAVVGQKIICLANSSQPCVYTWKWSGDREEEIASNEATIVFSKPGLYTCEAACKIRQMSCSVVAKLVQVSPVAPTSDYRSLIIVVASILIILVGIVAPLAVILWWLKVRRNQKQLNGSTEENEQLVSHSVISGLTLLAEKVYICRLHSADVTVYDSVQFACISQWRIHDIQNPIDLICNGNRLCLLDFKESGEECEIVTVTSNGKLINKWSTGTNYWGAISASTELHIILTVRKTNTLIEYSSYGQLLRQIVLKGSGILNPWHSVKLTSREYIICHGGYGLQQHRVCAVRLSDEDSDGEIYIDEGDVIKTCDEEWGPLPEMMDAPIRLDVGANDSIYVADYYNGHVLELDTELKLKREHHFPEKHGLRHPLRLQLDEAKDRFLVSDYFQVLVCQLSQNSRQWFDINQPISFQVISVL